MGYFSYASAGEYEFDDRVLAHVKVAIGIKLRRQESFFLNWANPADKGSGRISLWITPSIPLIFRFAGNRPPELNKVWVDELTELANSPKGLVVISEKEAEIMHSKRNSADTTA